MDNVTHSMAGWALGQAGLKNKTRKGLSALILGANMPDIDVFLGWVPWEPLATHRGWTHSFLGGVPLLPPVLAGLLWLFDRWQARRGVEFASGLPMRFGWLLALSYLGTLTHPLLDWQTSYAIQLFTPLDRRWYHADTLFILDVWIWLGLGGTIWLSRRRERSGTPRWRRPALVGLAGLGAYLASNAAITGRAHQVLEDRVGRTDTRVASPPPVAFWRRDLIWRQGHAIWRAEYDPLTNPAGLGSISGPVPDGMDSALARGVLQQTPALASFRRWSILPMAGVEPERCRIVVQFQDARFGERPGAGRLGREVVLPRPEPGC